MHKNIAILRHHCSTFNSVNVQLVFKKIQVYGTIHGGTCVKKYRPAAPFVNIALQIAILEVCFIVWTGLQCL